MDESDNVVTALEDLAAGREFAVDGRTVRLSESIAFGHKFAVVSIEAGDPVRKYGEVIGEATTAIGGGDWVHTHNVVSKRGQPETDPGLPDDSAESVEGDP